MNQIEKKVPKEQKGNPVLGAKLASFRKKLAMAIGLKKITQPTFAEMYGVPSGRALASYELGDSEAPATLFYTLWEHGHSIDAIFAEGPVTDPGREKAARHYQETLDAFSEEEKEKLLREIDDVKKGQRGSFAKTPGKPPGKGKTGPDAPRKTKKH